MSRQYCLDMTLGEALIIIQKPVTMAHWSQDFYSCLDQSIPGFWQATRANLIRASQADICNDTDIAATAEHFYRTRVYY
jgi:hypothetical protein